jgi:hypothetical protein
LDFSLCKNLKTASTKRGLRIAPPEAPTTGYRLGKGIYLADTVSKSGSYCFTDASRPAGVMMLAEAALGRQWTTKKDKFVTFVVRFFAEQK